jgi:hypothetical protein
MQDKVGYREKYHQINLLSNFSGIFKSRIVKIIFLLDLRGGIGIAWDKDY